jgi:hypothetical protein
MHDFPLVEAVTTGRETRTIAGVGGGAFMLRTALIEFLGTITLMQTIVDIG